MQSVTVQSVRQWLSSAPPPDWQNPWTWVAAVAAAEAVVILVMVISLFRLRQRLRSVQSAQAKGRAFDSTQSELASLYDKALTGSLDRFAIDEVIQFVNSIRETGILDILDESLSAVHRLLIREGEIVDAFNGDLRGEPAVHAILECRQGSFTFIRGDLPPHDRTINKPTITILMERMQVIDESADHVDLFRPGA
jgi:hypothetical protein